MVKASRAKKLNKGKPRRPFRPSGWWILGGASFLVLGAIVALVVYGNSAQPTSGTISYQVGTPGPGADAPPIRLTATDGSVFDLSTYRGKTVLLFFQEGISCEPCWTQLRDIEAGWPQFQAAGIDAVVSITGDPLAASQQKVAVEGLKTAVLADPGLRVSQTYNANQYGMMGTSADGHTFIVVGPGGKIRWRADYGGAPNYTMYVRIPTLLADMNAATRTGT